MSYDGEKSTNFAEILCILHALEGGKKNPQPNTFPSLLASSDQSMPGIYQNCTAEQSQFLQFLIVTPKCIRKEVFSSKKTAKESRFTLFQDRLH